MMCNNALQELSASKRIIAGYIPNGAHVLDVGCGDGTFMAWLATHKSVRAQGIEIQKDFVQQAIANGLSVVQSDAEDDIAFYRDKSYDILLFNESLQMMQQPDRMLREAVRVADKVIVAVPNFGYWYNRFYLAWYGRMPVSKQLNYAWYETPNIHFCTLGDFAELSEALGLRIIHRAVQTPLPLPQKLLSRCSLGNLFAQKGVFVLSEKQ